MLSKLNVFVVFFWYSNESVLVVFFLKNISCVHTPEHCTSCLNIIQSKKPMNMAEMCRQPFIKQIKKYSPDAFVLFADAFLLFPLCSLVSCLSLSHSQFLDRILPCFIFSIHLFCRIGIENKTEIELIKSNNCKWSEMYQWRIKSNRNLSPRW